MKDSKEEERRALKRAHFILPRLATVYPISAANPPHMPTTQEEKRGVEQRERERRRRVVRQNSFSYGRRGSTSSNPASGEGEGSNGKDEELKEDEEDEEPDYWSMEKVDGFYRECCEGRDEFPHPRISAALKVPCFNVTCIRCLSTVRQDMERFLERWTCPAYKSRSSLHISCRTC